MASYDTQPIAGLDGRAPMAPGKSVKFTVVDPTTHKRSSTWLVKTGKRKDDVYLMEEISGCMWKTSHHNDWGTWRVAMTGEAADSPGAERQVIDQWPRMAPLDGWSEGVTVLVPCADLRSPGIVPRDASVVQVPTSTTHSAVAIRLLMSEPGNESLTGFSSAFPIGVLLRPNGGSVYLIAEPVSLGTGQHEALAAFRDDARRSLPEEHHSDRFVGVVGVDDRRILVDLSLS